MSNPAKNTCGKTVPARVSEPRKPNATASFNEFLFFYRERKLISERRLALLTAIDQPRLNKLANGILQKYRMDELVRICLVLGLTPDESQDLMARVERALSPANPLHVTYKEIISLYADLTYDLHDPQTSSATIFEVANNYLDGRGMPYLGVEI